jgi:hypothetical protein
MATKKFSLKDNPIFESTVIPIKKDRKKHPLDTIYSPSEKRKVSMDKIKEGLAKKVDRKVLFLGAVTVIMVLFFLAYPAWRTVLRIDHPAPPVAEVKLPPVVEQDPLEALPLTGQAQEAQPEELLTELAVIEAPPTQVEEEKLLLTTPIKLRDERWLLSAIIFDGANSRALINHRIVRKGDTLLEGEVKVGEITPNSVVLIRGEETFTLKLK